MKNVNRIIIAAVLIAVSVCTFVTVSAFTGSKTTEPQRIISLDELFEPTSEDYKMVDEAYQRSTCKRPTEDASDFADYKTRELIEMSLKHNLLDRMICSSNLKDVTSFPCYRIMYPEFDALLKREDCIANLEKYYAETKDGTAGYLLERYYTANNIKK